MGADSNAISTITIINYILIAVFLLIFIFIVYQYTVNFYRPISEKISGIKELNEKLNAYDNNTVMDQFESFSQEMEDNDLTKGAWRAYSKTFTPFTTNDNYTKMFSISPASDFFNMSNLISEINVPFYQNLSGICTGIGILGTFLGLTVGLATINTADNDALTKSVRNLLEGMNTAFITSVLGLLVAVFFTYFTPKLLKNLEQAVQDLANRIDQLFTIRTAESWLAKNYEETQQQTMVLKRFDTELAMKVGDALDNSLEKTLKPVMEKLLESITLLNTSGIEAVGKTIAANAGTEMKAFAQTLEKMQQTLENLVSNSKSVNDEINRKMIEAVTKMTEALDASGNNISEKVTAASEKMKDNLDKHEKAMLFAFENVEKMVNDARELVKQAGDSAEKFSASVTPVQKAVEAINVQLKQAIDANNQFANTATTTAKLMEDATTKNQNAVERIEDSVTKMQDAWSVYEKSIKGLSDELDTTFQHLHSNLVDYNKVTSSGLEKKLDTFDKTVNSVLQSINGQNEEIADAIDDLQKAVIMLNNTLKNRR